MAGASDLNLAALSGTLTGRSGRVYRDATEGLPRRGSKTMVREVLAQGPPRGGSTAPEGTRLALKTPWKGNPEAPDAIDREGVLLVALNQGVERPPFPKLYDTLEEQRPGYPRPRITGLVLEWCPENLEIWWVRQHREPEALPALFEALAEVAERVGEAGALLAARFPGDRRPSARLKPRNVVRGPDGRWLLSDFEEIRVQSLYDEHLSATQPLLGGENYLSPELIFNTNSGVGAASDTWSIGAMLYALLRVRPYVGAGAALPTDGTNSPHFRTHRMHLVTDLHTRKSASLAGRPLDPSQFLYADRLPDQDRRAVLQSLDGVFGERDEDRESTLAIDVVRVLDRALRVDPNQRYTDPQEMARELRSLGQQVRRLTAQGRSSSQSEDATLLVGNQTQRGAAPRPLARPQEAPPMPSTPPAGKKADPPARPADPPSSTPIYTEPTRLAEPVVAPPRPGGSSPPANVERLSQQLLEARVTALEQRVAQLQAQRQPAVVGVPTWVKLVLLALALAQLGGLAGIAGLLIGH